MTTADDREREYQLRKAERQAKKQELRLRQLETQIDQQQRRNQPEVNLEPPLYQTRKHPQSPKSFQKFGRKIVKFAKFTAFVVAGIAVIKVGFMIGMWITYLIMASIVAAVGYQIFLKDEQ
ncbi:MAG: UbiA family prenyltransferase [Pleurocapsa sp.]